jgi:hypothetical protein
MRCNPHVVGEPSPLGGGLPTPGWTGPVPVFVYLCASKLPISLKARWYYGFTFSLAQKREKPLCFLLRLTTLAIYSFAQTPQMPSSPNALAECLLLVVSGRSR